jgi:hypothetical protein
MLIRLWETPGCVPLGTWVPSPDRQEWLDGQSGGEILAAHANLSVEKQRCGLLSGLICFRMVAPPLQPGVLGPSSWYEVYDSPAICLWRESVISKILVCNR